MSRLLTNDNIFGGNANKEKTFFEVWSGEEAPPVEFDIVEEGSTKVGPAENLFSVLKDLIF